MNQLFVDVNNDWDNTIKSIIERPGVVMVIGDIDSGKTTFTKQLINAAVEAGVPTALVDADTGQSELGPPAAIGMTIVERPVESLRQLKARRLYFVGSTTPVNYLLPTVVGVKKMVDEAISRGAKIIAVDTSGLVSGAIGRKLKLYKIDLVSPAHIVGIFKKRELDPIISVVSKIEKYIIHQVKASPEVRNKPRGLRIGRRRTQFFDYFKNADRHFLRLDDIVCWGTYFTTGRAIRWQHYRTIERILKTRVLHAEVVGNGMYLVADCKPQMAGIEALVERYGDRQYTIACGNDFTNVLVGLSDSNANTIALGIIEAIDFKQWHMVVLTPAKSVSPVRIVQFGAIRIRPDGVELGRIKPGEI